MSDITMNEALDLSEAMQTVQREAMEALEERRDPEMVKRAIREGWQRGPERPAGTADRYGVPMAAE